ESSGTFTTKTPRVLCENNGGAWANDPSCSGSTYRLGCCVLGTETKYTTNRECELLSEARNLEKDYRIVGSENECLLLSQLQDKGACIIESGETTLCTHKTLQECNS